MSSESSSGFSEQELRKFSEAGRTIAAAVGTSVELWARAEAGVILKTWAGRTKVAKDRPLEISGMMRAYRSARRVAFGIRKGETPAGAGGINLGIRKGQEGVVWYRTRRRKFQMVTGPAFARPKWRIRKEDWPAVEKMIDIFRTEVRAAVEAAQGAAGLAMQSIVQIADDLGIRLEDVKGGGTLRASAMRKARNAIASNKTYYRNGYSVQTGQGAKEFYLTLVNRYPKAGQLFMDQTLRGVIAGRLKFFRRNLEEGTFLSAKRAAKAYPYLEVLRLAS